MKKLSTILIIIMALLFNSYNKLYAEIDSLLMTASVHDSINLVPPYKYYTHYVWSGAVGNIGNISTTKVAYPTSGNYFVKCIQHDTCVSDTAIFNITIHAQGMRESHDNGDENMDVSTFFVVQNISVYPNPAKNSINFAFSIPASGILKIVDIYGRILDFKKIYSSDGCTFDVSNYSPQFYLYEFISDDKIYSGKILIVK